MRKILIAILISGICFVSCNKEPKPLTPQEIKHKIDSITVIRIKESDEEAQIDLERRMKIEVKAKVDSIVNAEKTLPTPVGTPAAPQAPGKPVGTITKQVQAK